MLRTLLAGMGIALAWVCYTQAANQETSSPVAQPALPQRALLNRYCVTCHNEKLKTAGLMLDKMDVEKVAEGAPVWEKVIRKLRAGQMPPAGMPRPDKATYDSFATYLETELDSAAEAQPNPGRPSIYRLNRAEYTNAIRDLLAVDVDGRSMLPADDAAYGFDNIGAVLAVSPVLLERYMLAAEKISRLAIGDPTIPPVLETYDVPDNLRQEDLMSEELPFGSRGGIAIRHNFPLDGEYVIRFRLQRDNLGAILGIDKSKQLDVRLDGTRIKLFKIGGERKGKPTDAEQEKYVRTADEGLEVRIPVKAGTRLVGITFLKETVKPEGVFRYPAGIVAPAGASVGEEDFEGIASVTIGGPYDAKGPGETASRSKIFVCRPTGSRDEESCAKKILSTLGRRAYRRPVTDEDVQPLLDLYKAGSSKGRFEAGIGMALERILAGPEFLFRVERDPENVPPNTAYRISDLELASRLSFFLWSSIPDDELLDLAEKGKLQNPAVLEQQVRRMLADSRSEALMSNFGGQWLYLRNLRTKVPDPGLFPNFDANLREALQRETELFFKSIVREDRSVLDLLAADYTFLNERLARHYGIPNIYGSQFRRVRLNDEMRKGLLGQGSILTVTSYNTRTAPTLRGKWVLENILGTPPPPPPPDVPSLKDNQETKALTMRERMEEHRKNPACASCHKLMDPLGFALENFDAIGQWRTTSGAAKTPLDASGELPDGTKFKGPTELRNILLNKREQFVGSFTEKLLTYALGRGVEYYDFPAIRKITREAAPDYRWSSLTLGIVKSAPFQMRRSQEP
ncbi:MAG: DUF1592 domain-containing protein [Acidobacteria bacterium]|nr:DUF1592 domain-containing protein [Acidobacteriota bacterium]